MGDAVRNPASLDFVPQSEFVSKLRERIELAKSPLYDKYTAQLLEDLEFQAAIWHSQAQVFRRMPSSRWRRFFFADFSDLADSFEIAARQLSAIVTRFRAGL